MEASSTPSTAASSAKGKSKGKPKSKQDTTGRNLLKYDEARSTGPDPRDPRTTGEPCWGNHLPAAPYRGSVSGANGHAKWVGCERCKLRLSYTPAFGATGIHRSAGPLPVDTTAQVEERSSISSADARQDHRPGWSREEPPRPPRQDPVPEGRALPEVRHHPGDREAPGDREGHDQGDREQVRGRWKPGISFMGCCHQPRGDVIHSRSQSRGPGGPGVCQPELDPVPELHEGAQPHALSPPIHGDVEGLYQREQVQELGHDQINFLMQQGWDHLQDMDEIFNAHGVPPEKWDVLELAARRRACSPRPSSNKVDVPVGPDCSTPATSRRLMALKELSNLYVIIALR